MARHSKAGKDVFGFVSNEGKYALLGSLGLLVVGGLVAASLLNILIGSTKTDIYSLSPAYIVR